MVLQKTFKPPCAGWSHDPAKKMVPSPLQETDRSVTRLVHDLVTNSATSNAIGGARVALGSRTTTTNTFGGYHS
jgi:hypothetical protein